jgi:hypothetical protein
VSFVPSPELVEEELVAERKRRIPAGNLVHIDDVRVIVG